MNAIFFGCKRAFQASLRITRPWLSELGLTAARFDMLTAIVKHPYGVLQNRLRNVLGVSAATVSRVLRSLEQLGMIRRCRSPVDRRLVHVSLTTEGRMRIRLATYVFITSGAAQLAVDCALTDNRSHDESSCILQMDLVESALHRLRSTFRDPADLYYPWHPDD
jgi:DNA-binding MarR family transcriptional regulator